MRTKWEFVLVCVGLVLFICFPATAECLETTEFQITSSYLDETEPALGQNIVVYTQTQNDGLGDIWYQPLIDGAPSGCPFAVTSTPTISEQLVDVSGDYILFSSTIDGIVVFRISDGASWSFGDPLSVTDPHIHGEWVGWLDSGQVMLYNLNDLGSTVPPQPISGIPASTLEIGDRFAVWVESNDIVVWDLASATSTTIGSANGVIGPTTSGTWVAWMAYDRVICGSHGFIYDGTTHTTIDVPGGYNTYVIAINDFGTVAGRYSDASGRHGFIYDGTTYTTLDVPGGDYYTDVIDINNAGTVVGPYSATGDQGFIYDGTTYTIIDVPGASDIRVRGINDAGTAVGYYRNPNTGHYKGFIYDGTTYTTIDVPGALNTYDTYINNAGTVAGRYLDATGAHGFIYDGTTYTTIDVPGGNSTYVNGINDAGTVVGSYSDASGWHGFIYDSTTYTTLDVAGSDDTYARAINDAGTVVGSYSDASGWHGFIYDGTSYTTIDVPWADYVYDINNAGAVAGSYSGVCEVRVEAMNMDTNEHRVVVDNGSLNLRPSIHGDLIVWESNIACNYDIWVYRLSTGESFQVTTDSLDQQLGDVYGDLVAYVDDRGLNKDVFISRLEFLSDVQEIPTEGVHADAFARHQDTSDGPIVENDSETAEAQAAVQTADWDRVSSIARAAMASDLLDSKSELDAASPSSPNPIRENIEANSAASRMTNWVATTSDPEVTTAEIDVSVSIEGLLETGDFSGPPHVRCEVFAGVFFRACGYWGLDPARTLVFEAAARVDATTGLSTSGPWGGDFTPSGSGWWVDYSGSLPAAFTVPTNETFGWEIILGTEVHAKAPVGLAATAEFRRTGSFELSTSTPGVTLTADACPFDPLKTEPGICGCGVPDTDSDGDWVADCDDNCLIDFNPVPVCYDDFDCLGPGNSCNLETGYCTAQNDNDGDSDGDICDLDDDNDGVDDTDDNCPLTPNPGQLDDDYDGLGNACDFVFNNDGPLAHIEEVATEAAEIIGSINVPGGNGLINNLLGNGGVVHKVAMAVSEYDSGAIDEATYVESLQEALQKLGAFDNQLAAKIGNGQIGEPEASQLLAASSDIRATIGSLIANAGS
jgi:hypothetical protein